MPVQPIPDAYRGATPYLIVHDAAAALDFYERAFGARVVERLDMPGGKVGHAEFRVGDAAVMLADEFPEMGIISAKTVGGTAVTLMLYSADVDAAFARALAAGATTERPVMDQFYGDRSGTLIDPFGHRWCLATHIEDVSSDELKRRMAAMAKGTK